MKIIYIFILFICLLAPSLKAQNSLIDSLEQTLATDLSLRQRVDVYNALSDELWHHSLERAVKYADSAYNLVDDLDYASGLVKALANKGVGEYTSGNYGEAEKFYTQSIEKSIAEGIPSDVHTYYLNLLKKQGRFKEIDLVIKKLLVDSISIRNADPLFLNAVVDSYVEIGDVKNARKFISPVLGSKRYRTDSLFMAEVLMVTAELAKTTGQYDSAIICLEKGIRIFNSHNNMLGVADASIMLGNLRLAKGNIRRARTLLESALKLYIATDYSFGIAEAKRNLGAFYSVLGEYDRATEILFEALEIFEDQKNNNEAAKVYIELSWIYRSQGLHDPSEEFIKKAIAISEDVGNKATEALAYNIYGNLLSHEEKYTEAIKAYQKAYDLRKSYGDKKGIAIALFDMAEANQARGLKGIALDQYLEAYALAKEIDNKFGIAISEYTLGGFFLKEGDYEQAEKYLEISRKKLENLDSKENLMNNYLYTAELYTITGDFEESNEFYNKYIVLKDSIFNETKNLQIAELETKYDLKTKENEIDFLNLENKSKQQEIALREKTISNQRTVILAIVAGSVLLLGLLFVSYRLLRMRNKTNQELTDLNRQIQDKNEEITAQAEELQEANLQITSMNEGLEDKVVLRTNELHQAYKELDTFFYKSSHDFSGPITTFLGLAEVAHSSISDPAILDLFSKMEVTAKRLNKLVEKLKAMSIISADDLSVEKVSFEKIIDEVARNWQPQFDENKISFQYELSGQEKDFYSYLDLIHIVLNNLIENSVFYISKNPSIVLSIKVSEKEARITLNDNGQGIADEHKTRVFEMYYRANVRSTGNGLGLYLVDKAIGKLNGKIELKSTLGKGSEFNFMLPSLKQ